MMQRIVLVVLWALLGGCDPRPAAHSPQAGPVASDASGAPFLWTVTSERAEVALFGSVHVARDDMYPLPAVVEATFERADTLVLEVIIDEDEEASAAAKMIEAALLPKDDSLWAHLDPEAQSMVRTRLRELSMQEAQVAPFQPWFVSMMLTMAQLEAAGYNSELGIDRHFFELAKGRKNLLELESTDDQIALFASLSHSAENEELKQSLEPGAVDELDAIAGEWKLGKSALLQSELERMLSEYPDSYEAFFAKRNKRMAQKIAAYLQTDQRYFVVIGAGHLVGPQSVIEELRALGLKVSHPTAAD